MTTTTTTTTSWSSLLYPEIADATAPPEAFVSSAGADGSCPCCGLDSVQPAASGEECVPVCRACGYVHSQWIDNVPEWKNSRCDDLLNSGGGGRPGGAAAAAGVNVRCAAPQHPLFDMSVPYCRMQWNPRERHTRKHWNLGASAPATEELVPGGTGARERLFYEHCQHISQVALRFDIKRVVVDRMCWWFREMSQVHKFHGAMADAMKAACFHYACREYGAPQVIQDCADMFSAKKKDATRCSNLLELHCNAILNDEDGRRAACELSRRQRHLHVASMAVPRTLLRAASASDYIARYCSLFPSLPPFVQLLCRFVCRKVEIARVVPDNYPHSTAASLLFFLSEELGLGITKRELQARTRISEVTINRCYNKILARKSALLPSGARRTAAAAAAAWQRSNQQH